MDIRPVNRKTALLMALAVIGFGMLQAARIIDPGTGPYSRHDFALFGLFVDGCTFLVVALMSYFARIDDAKHLFILGACMAAVHVALSFIDTASMPLIIIRQIAAGMGWSLNVLCWMSVFVSYRPRYALPMIAGGYVINAAIPVIGGDCGIPAGFALLSVYGCAVILLRICMSNESFIASSMREQKPPATTLPEAFSRTHRAVAATFAVSLVGGFIIESDALASGIEYAQTSQTLILCLIMATGMLFVLLIFRVRKANMDYIAPIATLVIATVLGARVMTGEIDAQSGSLTTAILISFYVLLWLMLISEAYERTLPAFFLLGIALGVARLSVLLGRLSAYGIQSTWGLDRVFIAAVGIWVLLVALSLIFISYLRYSSKMYRHVFDNDGAQAKTVGNDAEPKNIGAEKQPALTRASTERSDTPGIPETDDGSTVVTPFDAAVDHLAATFKLSERESQVIRDYAAGRSARYIAEWHMLSEHTVKTHLRRAYAKLDIHSRQELLDRIDEAEAQMHRKS